MWSRIDPNAPPTLLIGLGGSGSRIVDEIYGQVKHSCRVSAFVVDNNCYDLVRIAHVSAFNKIALAQDGITVGECLKRHPGATEWFPTDRQHKDLLGIPMTSALTKRIVGRLAYEMALVKGRFDMLLTEADEMAEYCVLHKKSMRVVVVSSLFGGASSGTFLQIALLVKDYLTKQFPALKVKVYGEFLLPDATAFRKNLKGVSDSSILKWCANTYAALKELNAINQWHFHKTAPIKLPYGREGGVFQNVSLKSDVDVLPYDSCFFYNWDASSIEAVLMTIGERLFSVSAADINRAMEMVGGSAENLFGTVQTETLPLGSVMTDSKIVRSVISRAPLATGKRLLFVCAPQKVEMDWALLPPDTICMEKVDSSYPQITITERCFDMELCKLERFRYGSGEYYCAYRGFVEGHPAEITPHLHKDWHEQLPDIGAPADAVKEAEKPKAVAEPTVLPPLSPQEKQADAGYVFISYSTADSAIANQTKLILETNGISCWMAPQSIPAGGDYGSEIPKAIAHCGAFLLMLSESSQKSPWVPKEVGLAISERKIVIPFHIDNAAIDKAFNFYLTNSQRIPAYNRMAEAYQELLKRLRHVLSC